MIEKILSSRSALEGERKQVSVLFADLKGSTELLADRDPEDARRLLDAVLDRMIEAVHRYEGVVSQVMGDGIMALFGAPLAHEDHAVRACYAALRMQESVRQYADEVRRTEGVPIHIRTGVNSGEVVVRSIRSDLRMDYTAVGLTTHLAARMEQLANPGSILITPSTLRFVEGFAKVKPLGPIRVKGLIEPLEVYEVIGAEAARSRLQASAARGLTSFVGRRSETEALREALERAASGRGQVVALFGEPGVGKSRIVWEFTRSHRTHGWLVLESSAVSYGKATSYLPVIDLIKAYFHIEPRDDARRIREKVTGKLLTLDEALRPGVPALLSLLDVRVDDAEWHTLEPAARRQRTLDALKRLVLRESQVQPLLLVFEDLHWIDAETQGLLDSLIESLPTARILLIVNYRPEYQHGWGNKTYYTQLRVDPLPPESAEAFLEALLGDEAVLPPLKRVLIGRTEGNPFFMEEIVRELVETGVLVGHRGAYRQARPLESVHVPATVQAVLAARTDRLPPDEKQLLQSAAVIGKDVPYPLLNAIAGAPEDSLRAGLAHLQAAEFLYEASLFPDIEYTFKHALTYEVAYASLLHERRRDLHARILHAIERLYPDRLAEQVERLAQHAVRGEVWDKAFTYLREAGIRAAGRAAYDDAVRCLEQALDVLQLIPQDGDRREQAIDLRLELRRALFALGEFGRMLEYLREAETEAASLGDQRRLVRIASYISQDFWAWGTVNLLFLMGDHLRAVGAGERALAVADATADFARRVISNYSLGEAYHALGDYQRAMSCLRRVVESLQGDHVRERLSRLGFAGLPSVFSRALLVRCLAETGEFAEGVAFADEAIRIAEAAAEPVDLLCAYSALGALYLRRGESDQAIPLFERCLAFEQVPDHPYWFPVIASALGSAYTHANRVPEALPLIERAVERSGRSRIMGAHALRLVSLGEAYLLAGRPEDAARCAWGALEVARAYKERGHQAWSLRLVGDIASDPARAIFDQAEDAFRQAAALAEELGMRPLRVLCSLDLGTLYARNGKIEQARAELDAAVTALRAMKMQAWIDQAERELLKTHGTEARAGPTPRVVSGPPAESGLPEARRRRRQR